MKKIIVILSLFFITGCVEYGVILNEDVVPLEYSHGGDEMILIEKINELRVSQGLNPLRLNSTLSNLASRHSEYMASIGEVSHKGFSVRLEYVTPLYGSNIVYGENLAYGFHTPEGVISEWLRSEGHRKVLLGEKYSEHGLSIRYVNGRPYITHLLIG